MSVLLDEDLLTQLDETGATEQVWLLLEESTNERLHQLGRALEQNDREELRRLAHALKGSALQCGARGLGRSCAIIEAQALLMESRELAVVLHEASDLWDATREAFRSRPSTARTD